MTAMAETPTKSGLRERQRLELRSLIYETALELFRTRGFEATTVQEIAITAGIGKGTFFNHFPSKDHVLQEWYRLITRSALKAVAAKRFETGREAVLALTARLTRAVERDASLWDAKSEATSSALLRQEESALDKEVFAFFQGEIERDIAAGQLDSGADAAFLADMALTVLTGSAHSWTVSSHSWSLKKMTSARINFVFDAARTGKEKRR